MRKRYRISIVVCEVIEEPNKLEERYIVSGQTEMNIHTLEIIRGKGNGDHAAQVLKCAMDMLRGYVLKPFIEDTEKI